MRRGSQARTDGWTAALLALAAMLWYARTLHFRFVNIDDMVLIADNPVLRAPLCRALKGIFTPGSMGGEALYIPITYLTYLAEARLFGLDPGLMHLTSAALHAINTALCYLLFRRWTTGRFVSIAAALIFALHPLQVESVAWLMSRKDLLGVCFGLLTLLAWECWRQRLHAWLYALALALFTLALLSKPTLVVLPAMIMAIDLWQRRLDRRSLLHTLPFWCFAVACWLVNHLMSAGAGGSRPDPLLALLSLPKLYGEWLLRLLLAAPPIGYYHKMYLWEAHPWSALAWLVPLALAAVATLYAWQRWQRGERQLLTGLALAALAMAPSVVIVFGDRHFAFGDRYSYLPMVGLALVIASLVARWRRGRTALLAIILLACLVQGWPAMSAWRDSISLWQRVLRYQPANPVAHVALGNAYDDDAGRRDLALAQYRAAIWHVPASAEAHNNLAALLQSHGELLTASRHYHHALALAPEDAQIHYHLGLVYNMMEKPELALRYTNQALALRRDFPDALVNRGMIYLDHDDLAAAERDFRMALQTAPDLVNALYYLGTTEQRLGRLTDAESRYRQALDLAPGMAAAWIALARVLHEQERTAEALQTLQAADRALPRHPLIQMTAARILLDAGHAELARGAYDDAVRLGHPPDPELETSLQQKTD